MKHQRIMLLLLLCLSTVEMVGCSPGHLGGTIIAFLRGGHLWTIDPNGANAFEIVHEETPIVGYSWAPNHQLLSYRALDPDFAKSNAGKKLSSDPVSGLIGDAPSSQNTIGVDGGTPISIAFSSPDIRYSNALWNSNDTRLLYRQTQQGPLNGAANAHWWISQNDQPGEIAVKSFPTSYSIPSLSYDTQHYLLLGNAEQGPFTTTLTGTEQHHLGTGLLPGHPLPASLERVLWRPAHQNQSFLYALVDQTATTPANLTVKLVLQTLTGQTTALATCECRQFAWSPDGNYIVYRTSTAYTILNVADRTAFQVITGENSVSYWSPDSRFLVLDGLHTLQLVNIAEKHASMLLSDNADGKVTGGAVTENTPGPEALLQPIANNIWAADSQQFIFLTHERLYWQGKHLQSGKGLYTVTIDAKGHPQGTPGLVDRGDDTQASWTYEDANTSFLY